MLVLFFSSRNGWDTCHSIATWSERLGVQVNGEKHDWWGVNDRKWTLLVEQLIKTDPAFSEIADEIKNFERHLDRAAVEWIVTMREGNPFNANFIRLYSPRPF